MIIEQILLKHLCHDCHPCIYMISRRSLIKRVVILHLLKSLLSLWWFEVVGQCFKLLYQGLSFKKWPAWCYNNLADNLLTNRSAYDHPHYRLACPHSCNSSKSQSHTSDTNSTGAFHGRLGRSWERISVPQLLPNCWCHWPLSWWIDKCPIWMSPSIFCRRSAF